MAKLTIQQAADAAGVDRSTIWRATNAGTLSYEKNEQGVKVIDTSELARVYPIQKAWLKQQAGETATELGLDAQHVAQHDAGATDATVRNANRNKDLEVELKLLRERFDMRGEMEGQKLAMLNARIEELLQDRDDLRKERDKLLTTVTEQATSLRLLTDQRVVIPAAPPPQPATGAASPLETGSPTSPAPAATVPPRRRWFGFGRS